MWKQYDLLESREYISGEIQEACTSTLLPKIYIFFTCLPYHNMCVHPHWIQPHTGRWPDFRLQVGKQRWCHSRVALWNTDSLLAALLRIEEVGQCCYDAINNSTTPPTFSKTVCWSGCYMLYSGKEVSSDQNRKTKIIPMTSPLTSPTLLLMANRMSSLLASYMTKTWSTLSIWVGCTSLADSSCWQLWKVMVWRHWYVLVSVEPSGKVTT